MHDKYLHIISFNIPYPPDYGGVQDIFYKISALKDAGIKIILHCYEYGRQPAKELEELCLKVYYYPRKAGLIYYLSRKPYIISTRNAKSMPNNLFGDSFPVLFEGLHTTACLESCVKAGKKILVRAHNIEHRYYRLLARSEPRLLRKIFLLSESIKLKRYEPILEKADHVLGISNYEFEYFNLKYSNAYYVSAFHKFHGVTSQTGQGEYILFHGNLSVPENSEVFLYLAREVLSRTPFPVVVAGKDPSVRFIRKASRYSRITIIPNPPEEKLDGLIRNAQVNLLYTFQSTGIKLKLLHALHAGRHCLANPLMVEGTGLAGLCSVADNPEEAILRLNKLMKIPFNATEIVKRKTTLSDMSNRVGAEKISRLLD